MIYKLRELSGLELSWMYERRRYLKNLIEQGIDIDRKVRREIRDKFGISYSTLAGDIYYLTVNKLEHGTVFVSEKVKRFIHERDKYICTERQKPERCAE